MRETASTDACAAAFPLAIPEMSIESLDESYISRGSLEVLNTSLSCFTRNRDSGTSRTNMVRAKIAVCLCALHDARSILA